MSVNYDIVCDGCGFPIDGSLHSAADARLRVREMGGRVNLPGGKDLCPECVRTGRKPE